MNIHTYITTPTEGGKLEYHQCVYCDWVHTMTTGLGPAEDLMLKHTGQVPTPCLGPGTYNDWMDKLHFTGSRLVTGQQHVWETTYLHASGNEVTYYMYEDEVGTLSHNHVFATADEAIKAFNDYCEHNL